MYIPLQLVPWLLLAFPVVSIFRWAEVREKRKRDYAHFIEWKEFPLLKIATGKLVLFGLLGLASVVYSIPLDKTLIALVALGICGYLIEGTIALGRPRPTPGYRMATKVCERCSLSDHEGCTNLRMLDGFESEYKTADGYSRPVCCCGFRLAKRKEALA